MGSTWQNEMWQAQEAHITIVQGTQIKLQISQEQKAKGKRPKKKKKKKKKASNSGKKRMGNEETKRMKENNNGMAEVPLTCNLANARELGPMVREITEMMVWWKGKKSLVSILLGPLLADTMLGKHLYQNG